MTHLATKDPTYVLGRSDIETTRLAQQAELLEPSMRRLFKEAGITTGMTVLDLGSGTGDVAMLAAEMVGQTGYVVGADSNPALVSTARARAEAAGISQVTFITGDIREVEFEQEFDAVVGRFVLLYLADPVAALRNVLRAVRENGLAVFYECNFPAGLASFPVSALHQLVGRCVSETFARGGVELAMGWKMRQTFLDAGLVSPQLYVDALINGGAEWMERFAPFMANLLRSLMPKILEYGIATEEEIAIETFEQRYLEEVISQRSVVQYWSCVGAWARNPSPR
jgi:ubiquinone/menaquinone biosynthesis C-methylase UbiE